MNEPSPDNDHHAPQADLILSSLQRLTGRVLLDAGLTGRDRARALYEAPFCVLSHDTADDPVFNYGNRAAQELFEMSWEELTRLPSRYSAEPQTREEREQLLAQVRQQGWIGDYRGVRVSATGRRFRVEEALVWNMLDEKGGYRGQAAVLFEWSPLGADGEG